MNFFKRFVCIITVVAVLASIFAVVASAAPSGGIYNNTAKTHWEVMNQGEDAASLNMVWNKRTTVSAERYQFIAGNVDWLTVAVNTDTSTSQGQAIAGAAGFNEFLTRFKYFNSETPKRQFFFTEEYLGGLAADYSVYSQMAYSYLPMDTSNQHYGKLSLGEYKQRLTWYDGSAVDFNTLSACCVYLQNQGFYCQVLSLPYVTVLGTDTYKYGQCHVIAFTGSWSGGWVVDDPYGDFDAPWYLLSDPNGSIFCVKYGEVKSGDKEVVIPDTGSSFDDDDRNYLDNDILVNAPMTYWDDDQFYFMDFGNNLLIGIDSFSYDPSLYQYAFSYTDNSTDIDITYNITYNIDYTQVTYIGASEEYEAYKYYYQLPDGRSSADMTAEDLEQLNLNYDVINYGKSADDGRLRSLYHLDGNTDDSSYWVNDTKFEWITNPSIEYLEATNFEGCLYLDEQDHKFELTLPSNLAASDFTLQFRYYHYGYGDTENNTATNYEDLIISATSSAGNVELFTNLAGTLTTNSTTPIGIWSEVAVIRDGGTLYTYVNGVSINSAAIASILTNKLIFDFQDIAVRRQIDEIRVFSYAMYEAGESYTPITVPMDTNLVLILPDEATPLPDAYWDFNTDGNLLTYQDFTQGEDVFNSNGGFNFNTFGYSSFVLGSGSSKPVNIEGPMVCAYVFDSASDEQYNASLVVGSNSVSYKAQSVDQSSLDFGALSGNEWGFNYSRSGTYSLLSHSTSFISVPIYGFLDGYDTNPGDVEYNPYNLSSGTYTFSIMMSDGEIFSITFDLDTAYAFYNGIEPSLYETFDWGHLVIMRDNYYANGAIVYIVPNAGSAIDFVYMELVEGSAPNDQSDAYKTVIYNDAEIEPNTIAIRSAVPVRSWRIGGVRPTLPYKGDVWLMIQDSRITSCQIYNGYMWVETDCRIWTGERWAWPNYFNILTQQDMTDIKGTTDNVYIQDDEGYYSWITEQWKELLDLLNFMSDQLSDIDGGVANDFNFDFNFDGTISVEFNTSLEFGRNSLYEILQFFWDGTFKPSIDSLTSDLDTFGVILDPAGGSIVIDGVTVESPMGIIGKEYDWTV